MQSAHEIVYEAIKNKRALAFTYKGHYREACPHAMGLKKNRRMVLVYQFGGQSSSGAIVPRSNDNWRALVLDEMHELREIDAEWQSFSTHLKPANCIDVMEIEVDY